MRCLSFFGHPCLCLQIPSFQGFGGIFTRWILAMPGTLRYRSALSSVCESLDSHTPLLRCQNTHAAQLRSGFVALHQGKIIKNRLEVLKSDRLLAPSP